MRELKAAIEFGCLDLIQLHHIPLLLTALIADLFL
jgi:hypothetical protein